MRRQAMHGMLERRFMQGLVHCVSQVVVSDC